MLLLSKLQWEENRPDDAKPELPRSYVQTVSRRFMTASKDNARPFVIALKVMLGNLRKQPFPLRGLSYIEAVLQ